MRVKSLKNVQWWKGVVFLATYLIIVLIFRTVLMVAMVDGTSMEGTLRNNDILIMLRGTEAKDGDIIAFTRDNGERLIKRIIAKEGEQIKIIDNRVFVNDKELNEPYLKERMETEDFEAVTVPKGKLFVMGDNRNVSADSRYNEIGFISKNNIEGKYMINLTKTFKSNTVVIVLVFIFFMFMASVADFILEIKPKEKEVALKDVSSDEGTGQDGDNT